MFVVVVTLQPRPLPSLGLDERFTRIDYTAKCKMLDVLEDMARVLRVPAEDITLLEESGERAATLEHTLGEYHDQHVELSSSFISGKRDPWPQHDKRQRKQISLKVQHTPMPQQLVTCTVQGGEGCSKLRPATVQLPNTATFGELLELAREKRYGGLEFEGPVHGAPGELDTTLRDAWVRNGCKIDGTLHIGLAVVVSFPAGSQKSLSLVMGPRDAVDEVKRKVYAEHGFAPSQQKLMVRGGAQQLGDSVALDELLVSGVPVGGFSSAGWSELHLELRVRECALPLDSSFRATLRDESSEWPTSSPKPFVGVSSPSSGESRKLLRPHQSAPQQFTPLALDPHAPQETEAGRLGVGGGGGGGSVGDQLSSGSGGAACPIVVFGLSPSGRVFTLSTRGGATVLDAKGQIAILEGVSPCRQRLLWRGINLEPDRAPLHELGIRNGDTLIVGYKLAPPDVTPCAAEQEGNVSDCDDDTLVAEMMVNEKHYAPEDENCALNSDTNNGNESSAESTPTGESAEAAADGHENNAAVAGKGSAAAATPADAAAPADARARNDGVDVAGGKAVGRGAGEDSAPLLPSGSAAGESNEKATGRRRAWWSRKKPQSTRRPGDSDEQGRDEGLAGVVVVPPSASPSTIFSPDSANNGVNARRARVAPAPEVRVHLNNAAARQPLIASSAWRRNLAAWARLGRRMHDASPTFSDGGGGGSTVRRG